MTISDTTENAILNLIFSATTWANYAINATTSPETNIVCALHSADPGDAGTQATSEIVYTSYGRVNVARSTGFTTASAGSVNPAANIDFPAGTGGGPGPANFWSTGKSGGGATAILWSGAVSPTITVGNGITPRLTTASAITLD
jgi:hypothetical protein